MLRQVADVWWVGSRLVPYERTRLVTNYFHGIEHAMPPRVAVTEIAPSGSSLGTADHGSREEATIAGDHSVDLFGRPVDNSKTGSWRAAPFIFGMDIGETIATLGITLNLVGYLVGRMHLSVSKSANIMTNFMGTNYLMTVFWGFVADSFLGKFWTLSVASFILLSGLTLLTLSVALPGLEPDKCVESLSNHCDPAGSRQMAPLYAALYLVAAGSGGIKPSISVLGADQFDDSIEVERVAGNRFFNWFFFSIQIGSFICVTFLVYVQDNAGFTWGYGVLCGIFLVSYVGFLIGTPFYRHKVPSGSAITRIAQVFVATFRKWKAPYPKHSSELYEVRDKDESAIKGSRKLKHTKKFRCLDKAAIVTIQDHDGGKETGGLPGPWRLCTVTQVEELKSILQMIPIWATTCVVYTLFAQLTTFSLVQAGTMDRHIGEFQVPPASLPVFSLLVVLFCVPLYDIVFVPFARRITGHPRGITPLQRIGVGIFVSISAMIIAALVERKRMYVVNDLAQNREDIRRETNLPISVFWLVPQYTILGVTEMFTAVGQLEFFYSEAPDGMRGIATSFYYTAISIGYFMSTVIVKIADTETKHKNHGSWLKEDLNDGGLKKFYWLLAVLVFGDFCAYLLFSHWYVYKEPRGQADALPVDLECVDRQTGYATL